MIFETYIIINLLERNGSIYQILQSDWLRSYMVFIEQY